MASRASSERTFGRLVAHKTHVRIEQEVDGLFPALEQRRYRLVVVIEIFRYLDEPGIESQTALARSIERHQPRRRRPGDGNDNFPLLGRREAVARSGKGAFSLRACLRFCS